MVEGRSHAEAILRAACEEIVRNSEDPEAKGYCRWCHGWNCSENCPSYIADQALQQANDAETQEAR
jgi:hypothetical protein